GYGLIMRAGVDGFLVVARGTSVKFSQPDAVVELDTLTEGVYRDGQWLPGRTLNGDERYFMFPHDELRTVRIELLRRAAR
ncbi:MAG: DUF5597 domain-containing protein, partial [Acidimicrobiales bacterium]